MNSPQVRRILKTGGPAARYELATLLDAIWVSEVVCPSKLLIVAASTLNDVPVVDNRTGGFSDLEPSWSDRVVWMSELVFRVVSHGGEAWVITRKQQDAPNLFLPRLKERMAERTISQRLRAAEVETLTTTGVYGDGFILNGSIAFTAEGPDFEGDGVVFEIEPAADRRKSVRTQFEGLLT